MCMNEIGQCVRAGARGNIREIGRMAEDDYYGVAAGILGALPDKLFRPPDGFATR